MADTPHPQNEVITLLWYLFSLLLLANFLIIFCAFFYVFPNFNNTRAQAAMPRCTISKFILSLLGKIYHSHWYQSCLHSIHQVSSFDCNLPIVKPPPPIDSDVLIRSWQIFTHTFATPLEFIQKNYPSKMFWCLGIFSYQSMENCSMHDWSLLHMGQGE